MANYQYIKMVLEQRKYFIEQNRKCHICFIGLFGSQNYGLDDKTSDIDCVAVTIPSLDELIAGIPSVKTLEPPEFSLNPDKDSGTVKLMDLRDFAKQLSKGSFVNLEALLSDYVFFDDMFKAFYLQRFRIYDRYIWNFQNAVYGGINHLLKQFDTKDDDRQCKRVYEMLRLFDFYERITDEKYPHPNPNFYISNLSKRSHIGLIKSGCSDYESDVEKIRNIVPPYKTMPELPSELATFSAEVVAKVVIRDSILKEISNKKLTTFS